MLISTQAAEYLLVEYRAPGGRLETIGVLLYDPSDNRLEARFRRDWDQFVDEDDEEVLAELANHFDDLVRDLGPEETLRMWEESLSNSIRISDRQSVLSVSYESTLRRLYSQHVAPKVLPYRTHLPVTTCRAAAGGWGEQVRVEPEHGWIEMPEGFRLTDDMFVAQVNGRSMEPLIPDGAWCVFRKNVVGSREGKRLLVENFAESESGGERYTVKKYHSEKRYSEDGEWEHTVIRYIPLNPEFEAWEIDDQHQCRVIGEFVRVLDLE